MNGAVWRRNRFSSFLGPALPRAFLRPVFPAASVFFGAGCICVKAVA